MAKKKAQAKKTSTVRRKKPDANPALLKLLAHHWAAKRQRRLFELVTFLGLLVLNLVLLIAAYRFIEDMLSRGIDPANFKGLMVFVFLFLGAAFVGCLCHAEVRNTSDRQKCSQLEMRLHDALGLQWRNTSAERSIWEAWTIIWLGSTATISAICCVVMVAFLF